jgi:hypothetical protein
VQDVSVINFRTDPDVDRALEQLTADGSPRSAVIRRLIVEAAAISRRDQAQADAVRLAADPADRAELAWIAIDMDAVSAW